MNILFVGDLNEHGRSFQRFRALKELGHEVRGLSFIPIGQKPGVNKGPTLIEKIMNKFGYPIDLTNINRRIVDLVNSKEFQVVWFEKCLSLYPSILLKIKDSTASKTVFFSTDNMQKRHNSSVYFKRSIRYYDIIFTITGYSKKYFYNQGAKRVVWVDRSYDRNYTFKRSDNQEYEYDIVFVGTFERQRYYLLNYIADNGMIVNVFGNNWPNNKRTHKNLIIHGKPLYGTEFMSVMHKSKIVLNFLRKVNDDITTGRSFEIPASGAFMLAERTVEHQRLFEEGREAAFFDPNNPDELLEKVRYYLNHSQERDAIAKAGLRRCMSSGYSHHDRLRYMLEQIEPSIKFNK